MAFKGIVTRKDKEAGVTLEAKIVSPTKAKSARRKYNITIKPNGLSDYECCVIDHATLKAKMEMMSLGNITAEIDGLYYTGVNGTSIEYTIDESSALYQYLKNDGTLVKRPTVQTGDINGQITIKVSKGEEFVSSRIPVVIKAYTATEAINNIDYRVVWDTMVAGTDNYNFANAGHTKIKDGLNFSDNIRASVLGLNSFVDTGSFIKATYTVTDTLLGLSGTIRMSTNGVFNPISYIEAYKLKALNPAGDVEVVDITNSSVMSGNRIKMTGLSITVKLYFEGHEDEAFTHTFRCSTLSDPITNAEVIDVIVTPDIKLTNSTGTSLAYAKTISETAKETIIATSGGTYELSTFSSSGTETITNAQYGIQAGTTGNVKNTITNVMVSNSICDIDGITPYNISVINDAFGGGFVNNGKFERLVIDFDALKAKYDLDNSIAQFCIVTRATTSSYKGDSASQSYYKTFEVDFSTY